MSGIELDLQAYSIPLLSHFTAFQGVPTQANITHCEILRIDYYSFELQNWRKLQFLGWLGKAGIGHIFFKVWDKSLARLCGQKFFEHEYAS